MGAPDPQVKMHISLSFQKNFGLFHLIICFQKVLSYTHFKWFQLISLRFSQITVFIFVKKKQSKQTKHDKTFVLDSRPSVFNNGSLIYDRRKLTALTRSQQDVRASDTSIQVSTIEVPTSEQPSSNSSSKNSVLKSVLKFYTSSISKFLISLITYLTYLFIISNVVLYESKTQTIHLKEKILLVFNIALLFQSIQLFFNPRVFFGFKVQLFCYCEWNLVGICCIFLGFLGFSLKFIDQEVSMQY